MMNKKTRNRLIGAVMMGIPITFIVGSLIAYLGIGPILVIGGIFLVLIIMAALLVGGLMFISGEFD